MKPYIELIGNLQKNCNFVASGSCAGSIVSPLEEELSLGRFPSIQEFTGAGLGQNL